MLENRALRRIFGCKMEEVTEGWRRQHSEELCTQPYFIRVIKSRTKRWAKMW
jgi:hypothetical protein